MGTVLPPWKLELIEKKRKRLQEEKAKEQEKIERFSNIPEWKRNILSKRKGYQVPGEDPITHNEDKPNATVDNDQIVAHNSTKLSQSRSVESRNSHPDVKSCNATAVSNENGEVDGHSNVTNCVQQSDKQRDEGDRTKLSNSHTSRESEDEGRVLYEHIKTPSELKRLYELRVAKRKALEEEQKTKDAQSLTRSKSSSDSQIKREDRSVVSIPNKEATTIKKESTELKQNGVQDEKELLQQSDKLKVFQEESIQAATSPAAKEITNEHAIDITNKRLEENMLQNGQDSSSEIHVQDIRNKFGPSGYFRRRSASSDNLLKIGNSEHTTPSGSPKPRPSPLNKRWSMISLGRGNEDNTESHSNLNRARSLSDVRGDPHADAVHLRHRASVSHDIEHRIHELLHHVSDGNTSDEWDDESFLSKERTSSITTKKEETEPSKERRASWFTSEQATNLIQIVPLPQDEKSLSTQNKTKSNKEKSVDIRNEIPLRKTSNTVNKSGKIIDVNVEKEIQVCEAENSESFKPELHDSGIEVNGESSEQGPSVHKLSALFGASIRKGNTNTRQNKKFTSEQTSPETKQENSKNDFQENSRKFPWMKNTNESMSTIDNNSTSDGKKFPFPTSQNLKPVQNKYVEQKITGNMTLVIGGGAKNTPNYKKTMNSQSSPITNKQKNTNSSSIRSVKQTSVDYDDEYITIIDVPDTSSHDDIQVSAIDIPESTSPTPVSVIDLPDTKDDGVKVSVIDVPQDSDSDSDSETSGSYNVNMFTFETDNSESRDEEEDEEEDIDNVPVSYYGDSTYMKVPEIIFETKPENVKPILSSPLRKRKRKNKVVFHPEKLEEIHDYPSEVCLQSHYDQMAREKGSNLANYQPSSLQNVNLSVQSLKPMANVKDVNENEKVKDSVKVTYSDDGEGFSTSSSSTTGAMLF